MLDPHSRRHLLEILRPPQVTQNGLLVSYEIDFALGTSFSLDLEALATVPLALAMFDWEDESGRPAADKLAVLQSLRRYADRVALFCQGGQISIPQEGKLLYHYLENSVIEVAAPNKDGVFHPKVWILRFTAENAPIYYRLACLTRNLTFDRSWDTALVLDGEIVERSQSFSANHPLADFVSSLPGLAIRRPISAKVKQKIKEMAKEIRYVQFTPPDDFEKVRFWASNIPGVPRWPFGSKRDRMLVVSPFVSSGCLDDLTQAGKHHVLISRPEELDKLTKDDFSGFEEIYYLNPAADVVATEEYSTHVPETELIGLHAKLFIADEGWNSRVWTGSANATSAAFKKNIEFLVELSGKRSKAGVDAFLRNDAQKTGFADLLQKYKTPKKKIQPETLKERLDRQAQQIGRNLASAGFVAKVESMPDELFTVQLQSRKYLGLSPQVVVRCWPITRSETISVKLENTKQSVGRFEGQTLDALTSFFAFSITVEEGNVQGQYRFVLNVVLEGVPTDRSEQLLLKLLQNRDEVLRLLLILLAGENANMRALVSNDMHSGKNKVCQKWMGKSSNLLEYLLSALDQNPTRLDEINQLVNELTKTPDGQTLLPEGFMEIWAPIWATKQEITK